MTEKLWRERMELGVVLVDELRPHWVAIRGEDFSDGLELVTTLTNELAEAWVAIFCFVSNAMRPVSRPEIAAALKLTQDEVGRCLDRLAKEKLVDEVAQSGTYTLAAGRRMSGEPDVGART